jgi:ABC-type bacteriocin/lantibiotic exporter with double-glycine peptidase domain
VPMHLLDVPYLQQIEPGGCLPACIAMVLAYLEQPALQEDISRQIGALPWGTPASNVRRLAGWGFQVRYDTSSLRELQTFLAAGSPPIAFLRTVDLPYAQVDAPHAVVIVGIHDDAVYLLDPDYPDQTPVVVSIGDFALAWSHFDQLCAIISKR